MNGVIILYNVADNESFEHVANWLEDVRRYSNGAEIMLVGTHYDATASITPSIPRQRALVRIPLTTPAPLANCAVVI